MPKDDPTTSPRSWEASLERVLQDIDHANADARAARQAAAKARHTPLVRALAEKHGLDITAVAGTGVGGRVTARDVRQAAADAEDEQAYRAAWPSSTSTWKDA